MLDLVKTSLLFFGLITGLSSNASPIFLVPAGYCVLGNTLDADIAFVKAATHRYEDTHLAVLVACNELKKFRTEAGDIPTFFVISFVKKTERLDEFDNIVKNRISRATPPPSLFSEDRPDVTVGDITISLNKLRSMEIGMATLIESGLGTVTSTTQYDGVPDPRRSLLVLRWTPSGRMVVTAQGELQIDEKTIQLANGVYALNAWRWQGDAK